MHQYVMVYAVSDGDTYSFTETLPIECDHPSTSFVAAAFERAAQAAKEATEQRSVDSDFTFTGHVLCWTNFYEWDEAVGKNYFTPPSFYTIPEWFAARGA
jgi:hypothetical protein